MAKKAAYMGMMTALAFVLSYLETLIPINLGVPGVKLGLANLVVIVALEMMGVKEACTLSLVRVVLTSFTFGNPAGILYSFTGGAFSLLAMVGAKKLKLFSLAGISVLGGVSHNIGQLTAAMLVVENASLMYYLPVLVLSGTAAGVAVGALAAALVRHLKGFEQR
ncbi:MAG: Gx transporter family protein [Lachnospiraceae bacterium]|jgi:heptaprenyl diphosphate synthase|nr:Gx transporter family protein [Lachnospiraceae bacterium]